MVIIKLTNKQYKILTQLMLNFDVTGDYDVPWIDFNYKDLVKLFDKIYTERKDIRKNEEKARKKIKKTLENSI